MIYAFHDFRIPTACIERLQALGFCPIALPACPSLSAPVCAHADLQMLRTESSLLIHAELAEQMPMLAKAKGVKVIETTAKGNAHEAQLCALSGGGFIFGNRKFLSEDLLLQCALEGLEAIHTNQGYAACSTLLLDGQHAITADEGMRRAMVSVGIDVLKISEGGVVLPPYPYGFIGGASGVHGDCVYFLGSLLLHPDGARIHEYIEACGMRSVSLADGALFDGGGIVFWESDAQIFVEDNTENYREDRDQKDACNAKNTVGDV